jgi:hypothetical protein
VISTAARGPRGLSPGWRDAPSGTWGRQATEPRDQEPDGYVPPQPRRPAPPVNSGRDGEPPDVELLRQHRAGDPDAFGTLYRRHRDRLWAVAIRTLGEPEEAVDALQAGVRLAGCVYVGEFHLTLRLLARFPGLRPEPSRCPTRSG